MGESSGSISIDVERISYCGEDYHIRTKHGSVAVTVFGDNEKPGIITYPDIALNHTSCFQRLLLFCPQASSLLLHNFCFYHICPPGHELGAAPISSDIPVPFVDDLADQVVDVLDFFGLDCVMCLGVTAGAYILSLFAIKHKSRVAGLILVSPLCKSPSWTEWMFNKVMSTLLYYYGMSSTVKDRWVQRYFSKELCSDANNLESEIVQACRRLLDERQSTNILRFLQSINWRHDITERLQKLQCQTLIFVGDDSPFHSDALDIALKLGKNYCALVEVQACGSVVTEEHPESMAVPLEYFLLGYGLNKPHEPNSNHHTTPGPPCISADLLSPESMGIKLKPIKTRVSLQAWG